MNDLYVKKGIPFAIGLNSGGTAISYYWSYTNRSYQFNWYPNDTYCSETYYDEYASQPVVAGAAPYIIPDNSCTSAKNEIYADYGTPSVQTVTLGYPFTRSADLWTYSNSKKSFLFNLEDPNILFRCYITVNNL